MSLLSRNVPESVAGRIVYAAEPCVQRDIDLEAEWVEHMHRSRVLYERFLEAGVPQRDALGLLPAAYYRFQRGKVS